MPSLKENSADRICINPSDHILSALSSHMNYSYQIHMPFALPSSGPLKKYPPENKQNGKGPNDQSITKCVHFWPFALSG